MEIFSVLVGYDLEPVGDAAKPIVERANLEKLGFASLGAIRTPEMFNPGGDDHVNNFARCWHGG
jgi:hypothetical protein